MRFDNAAAVEEIVWMMRLADEPRAADRTVILKQFNGNPPFDPETAEENNIQININSLEGPNLMSIARRQWDNGFLKPSNFFTCTPDYGPGHKRMQWGSDATRNANRALKRARRMMGQSRATGANTMLFGVGPTNWPDRRTVIPNPIPVGSLMIPSETEIDDFDNLSYFAIFREYTPAMLWDMTHGPKVDPGWNMDLVDSQMRYLADQLYKSPNSLAYQYMPERIEELIKQDKGYMGTDAVPTCDVWDFYFREAEDGEGWYRRIMLDWNTGEDMSAFKKAGTRPQSRNKINGEGDSKFLYTSGKRKYANSVSEILHCNFGDCSPYAPFKYHSIRGLGWMLWGICDLENRLHCKFNEAVFEQLMWFFQTAGNQDLIRLKKANFEHMGVIPQGIKFLTAQERFTPNAALIQQAFARNRQIMSDTSTAYTQDYDRGDSTQPETATAVMAKVNASASLATSIMELAYTYEAFKYREIFRRLCLKNSPDKLARKFRTQCLQDGIPEEMLDAEKWAIEPEQVIGGGNKTLQMATVGFLNNIRKNLPPDGQRIVDHLSVEAATDQPDLAEEIAPLGKDTPISRSTHDAQLSTDRLLKGLVFYPPKEAVYEDYVIVWMHDGATIVNTIMQREKSMPQGKGMITIEEETGLLNLMKHVKAFLDIMQKQTKGGKGDQQEAQKFKEYETNYMQLMNHIKALGQQLVQSLKQGNQENGQGADPKDAAKVQAMLIQAQTKAKISEQSAAQRTKQKEQQFQLAERRKDAQTAAEIQRGHTRTRHELMANRLKSLSE